MNELELGTSTIGRLGVQSVNTNEMKTKFTFAGMFSVVNQRIYLHLVIANLALSTLQKEMYVKMCVLLNILMKLWVP
jgi:acyl-ACP thioesterase